MANYFNKNRKIIIWLIVSVIFVFLFYYLFLFPKGRVIIGDIYIVNSEDVEFLYDLTYENENGERVVEQEIFEAMYEIIEKSENFLIVDMFLFGETSEEGYLNLTSELIERLVEKKKANIEMPIYFITDDFNLIGKPWNQKYIDSLEEVGVEVIFTPLNNGDRFWDRGIRYLMKKGKKNLNHRKVVMGDVDSKIVTFITSGNPHDLSSWNSNVGLIVKGGFWRDVYKWEKLDGGINNEVIDEFLEGVVDGGIGRNYSVEVTYLADGGLMKEFYNKIDSAQNGDVINIAIFYISDGKVIDKLVKASERGVEINMILDTNDFFFAQKKFGIPNKPVAEELIKESDGKINIRWYKSHGEQFHTKLAIFEKNGIVDVYLGSSNLVDNKVRFYNLQSDVRVVGSVDVDVIKEVGDYFDMLWNNEGGVYTVDYDEFKSDSLKKKFVYEWEQFIRWFQ